MRTRLSFVATVSVLFISAATALGADPPQFSQKPTLTKTRDGVSVAFAVSRPTDVEVAVLDAKGAIVRHLAAGVLGSEKAPPEPLQAGLAQNLTWDGKADLGEKAAGGPFKVRVRVGMRAEFGGVIGDPASLESGVYGLATDDRGQVYAATGGGYGDNLFTIKVFDRSSKYLKTIMPYPASLKPDDVAAIAKPSLRDGFLNPPQFNALLPWIYPSALGGLMGNRVENDVLWLTNKAGRLCRLRASDGAGISWGAGGAPAPPAQGPICWAASADGKTLYLAGWCNPGRGVPDGQVFKVDPATGSRKPFIQIEVPPKSFWLTEPNGWYHYTNWGRKNGLSAIHGLAADKDGRVYICDRVNQRIGVFDVDGKLLGSTAVEWPDHVALSPKGPEIYVTTRKIIDGYKAVNEVKVVKLSGWKDGKVLAELTLSGNNAPSMAVDATAEPAVVWLSNVGKGGVTRIEDRGKELVVTGRLNENVRGVPGGAVVKVWADPLSDDIVTSDGWSGLARMNGLTGEVLRFPVKGMDLVFGRDGNIYVYGQNGWHELVTRFNRELKPAPYPATGKNTTTLATTGADVYGRYGHGWSNKGLAVSPRGRIYVYNMFGWSAYYVNVWDKDGKAEKHDRVSDGLIGPIDAQGGGICVDLQDNVYVGLHGFPADFKAARGMMGTVVKFGPTGGGYVAKKADKPGIAWKGSSAGSFVEGAVTAYPELAPQVSGGCVCKEARFDLDLFGRLYVPNVLDYYVKVVDNAGNEVTRFGYYGNADSCGPKSAVPDPAIAFGWPVSVSAGQLDRGRIYVADTYNHRAVRLDLTYAAEDVQPAPE